MKKVLCIVLSLVILLSMSVTAFAANDVQQTPRKIATMDIVEQGYRIVQKNEAISILMEKKDYSYNDALKAVEQASTRGVSYGERWIKYDAGMGYEIEVGCLIEIECGSGHCNFGDVIEKWSAATGSGDYTWDEFYVYVEVGPPFATSINFRARGNLEVTTTTSSSAGFEAAGFSVVGSVSTQHIYRKTVSIDETWTVGDPLE